MASVELALQGDDSGINPRQLAALERLAELGAEPAPFIDGKPVWSSDPKIRALQMIFEGRLGGPREGSGRKKQPRAAEVIAGAMREDRRVNKMIRAIDRALGKNAGTRVNLDAIKLIKEIERDERKLQIEEEDHEGNIGNTREELIATLFALAEDPATVAAIQGSAEEITDAEVVEEDNGKFSSKDSPAVENIRSDEGSTSPARNGNNGGNAGENGASRTTSDSSEVKNPLKKAALRRAAERGRTA